MLGPILLAVGDEDVGTVRLNITRRKTIENVFIIEGILVQAHLVEVRGEDINLAATKLGRQDELLSIDRFHF